MEPIRVQKRGIERRNVVLETAIKLFAEKGYDNTSIQDIIKIAGGSNTMIYKTYGNKQGLFAAAVEFLIQKIFESSSKVDYQGLSLREELCEYGIRVLTAFFEPEALALYRLIVEESGHKGDLSQSFYENGMCKSYCYVCPILRKHTALNEEQIQDLATFYVESLKFKHFHTALLLNQKIDLETIRQDVSLSVDILLAYIDKLTKL